MTFIHNRVPHDRPSDDILEASLRMRRLLCEKSDAIVGLCEQTREVLKEESNQNFASVLDKKFFVVPHPVYECYGVQPYVNSKSPFKVGGNRFTFLFLGQVRPYKNIELILEVARVFLGEKIEVEFVVAGGCPTDYWRSLKTDVPANVAFLLGHVPDDEIVSLVSSADALILPYDVGSSLNSGSCMLAFSLKRTVVCPAIGTLQTVPKELVYSYSYTVGDQESHLRALTESARRAYNDMRRDPLAFADKGRRLYWHVSRSNSLQAVGNALQSIFEAVES